MKKKAREEEIALERIAEEKRQQYLKQKDERVAREREKMMKQYAKRLRQLKGEVVSESEDDSEDQPAVKTECIKSEYSRVHIKWEGLLFS